jgi:hypothetical protein
MNRIRLYYLTATGGEWLEEIVEVSENTYRDIIKDYLDRNQDTAMRLIRKWESNGEEVVMGCDVENVDCPAELFREIWNELDSQLNPYNYEM